MVIDLGLHNSGRLRTVTAHPGDSTSGTPTAGDVVSPSAVDLPPTQSIDITVSFAAQII